MGWYEEFQGVLVQSNKLFCVLLLCALVPAAGLLAGATTVAGVVYLYLVAVALRLYQYERVRVLGI